jgi:uncharacterized protein (TIGR02444 family)
MTAAPGFWPFSKAVYAQDGVKEACLDLQAAGLDVNVALFVVWAIATGRDPGPVMGEVLARSALWRSSVVQPLRGARDQLKPAPDFVEAGAAAGLRKAILKVELEAERLQQATLEPLAALCPSRSGPGRRTAAAEHLGTAARRDGAGPLAESSIVHFVEIVFSRLENV